MGNPNEVIEVLNDFLNQFESIVDHYQRTHRLEQETVKEEISSLLDKFTITLTKGIEADRTFAKNFNILDVVGIQHDEVRHSMIIAFLLDRWEKHSHGTLFFRSFLSICNLPSWFAKEDYSVSRELSGEESRVDIEILSKNYLIQIENKIGASEGGDQTGREFRDMVKRTALFKIPPQNAYSLFLTPLGSIASYDIEKKYLKQGFHPWKSISYKYIADALNNVLGDIGASTVKIFVEQYIRTIKKFIVEIEEEI